MHLEDVPLERSGNAIVRSAIVMRALDQCDMVFLQDVVIETGVRRTVRQGAPNVSSDSKCVLNPE